MCHQVASASSFSACSEVSGSVTQTDFHPEDLSANKPEPAAKKARRSKPRLMFREDWKLTYLMWPSTSTASVDGDDDDEMICIQCQERMKAKSSTATRHLDRKHPKTSSVKQEQRLRLLRHFESSLKK